MSEPAGSRDTKRVALVTGASSGIGRASCLELAKAGIAVVATARRQQRLDVLAADIQQMGGEATGLAGDITDPDLPERLIEHAQSAFGRLDIVVNNAGLMHAEPLADMSFDKIQAMIDVNITAAFRLSSAAVALFRLQGHGHLVQISSILGTKVRPNTAAYSGTKHALEALTEAARLELADTDVKITAIEPGYVTTELHDHWEVKPRERFGIEGLDPSDVARAVRFVVEQPTAVLIPRLMIVPNRQPL